MYDRFQRKIDYLRVSVTDRCNLRCTYCMPATGVSLKRHEDILSFEEIEEVCHLALSLGVRKIRITGGEPLVRRGLVDFIFRIHALEGLEDFALTTNGALLVDFAPLLKAAGLHRLNISLDTLDPQRFHEITRQGHLADTLAGIEAARRAGFRAIKLNCVIQSSPDEPNARAVAAYGRERNLEVRFIRAMDLARGEFWPVVGGDGGRCERCNRLRLSSDGRVFPCLFSDTSYSVRDLGTRKALLAAVDGKPRTGHTSVRQFHVLGG